MSRLIESDRFPFEFLSRVGERESWRKEVHRPIYHVHKWWAKRLGSVFRGILLGSALDEHVDLEAEFYRRHAFTGHVVFDPFMGSGTTIGEAHKLGFAALGRDINPVAEAAVRTALGPLDRRKIEGAFANLSATVGRELRDLYRSCDSRGEPCDVLYFFWVMQCRCPACHRQLDLFRNWILARNAAPGNSRRIQLLCSQCGAIFPAERNVSRACCPACRHEFDPHNAIAKGAKATCSDCHETFRILDALNGARPSYRLHAKLVLRSDQAKEYLPASEADQAAYREASQRLQRELQAGTFKIPTLTLTRGYNTRQAMRYGFKAWRDFFNDRQLLALAHLKAEVDRIPDDATRLAMGVLFSGVLEFNNRFASYKGEGTGAVRHMFSHHILKPERAPIEANVWGTPKSSGSFLNLFRSRLMRAIEYRDAPTEVNGQRLKGIVCSPRFTGRVADGWPPTWPLADREICLSCGDSSESGLPPECVDLVITDPPFFDNVHYSELADFFFAWQQSATCGTTVSTRTIGEVQDTDGERFAVKLAKVFSECHRVLKHNGLLVFTYHHSRSDGWRALVAAVLESGFVVVNAHPVKAEMSVATPKSQAKEPIQLDVVIVCRKRGDHSPTVDVDRAIATAWSKLERLHAAGLVLSRNDCKTVLFGQLLTACRHCSDIETLATQVEQELAREEVPLLGLPVVVPHRPEQRQLF